MLPATVNPGRHIHKIRILADVEFFDSTANSVLDARLEVLNAHFMEKGNRWELLVLKVLL